MISPAHTALILLLLTLPLNSSSAHPTCQDFMGNIIEVTPSIIGDDYCDCEDTGVDEIGKLTVSYIFTLLVN